MSCSMTTAVTAPARTTEDTVSMICVFSRVLTPLVEKEEFRAQRISHRDVEELALALRQAAGRHAALAVKPEPAEDLEGLAADVLVVVRKRRDPCNLALAREDRQRDIVENAKPVEQIDDLEAASDARLDPFVYRGEGDVLALEQDAAAVRLEMSADRID